MTAAVCKASAGAVEHLPVAVVTNLARWLGEVKRGDLWVYAASGDAETTMWDADLTGGSILVFGAEGKGIRPLVRRTCDARDLDPAARPGRVAERQRRRGPPALRGAAPARCLSRRSTCSTATTCSTPAASTTRASSATCSPASSPPQGADGVLVYDGVGRDETIGPLEVRYAEHADQLLEQLAAENRATRHVCVVSSDSAVRGTAGRQVQTLSSQTFLHDLEPAQLAAERPGAAPRPARPRDARAPRAHAPRRVANTRSYQVGSIAKDL